jgi:hypothetical protein
VTIGWCRQSAGKAVSQDGILRDHTSDISATEMKIWSDLHGDMQSQAEMIWPSIESKRIGSNKSVGPYPLRA